MDRCVSKPPCFKFLMAGIRLSLSSGPMATSMALTFYIRTLLPLLILRTSMPDDGGRSSEFNEQALVLLRAMARTQSHTHVGSVGQQGLHQRATTVHSELACRAAGTSSFQSQSWGVKQAEALGQSSLGWISKVLRGLSFCAWQIGSQGCRRCHSRVQGSETEKRLSHPNVRWIARSHWLFGRFSPGERFSIGAGYAVRGRRDANEATVAAVEFGLEESKGTGSTGGIRCRCSRTTH